MHVERHTLTAIALAIAAGVALPPPVAAQGEVTSDQVVSALEGAFGVTPGQRRNHIKGTCAAGEFVGTAEAAAYSRSALFSGKPVPVVARFSLAGGNPKAPDTAKSARGMALDPALMSSDEMTEVSGFRAASASMGTNSSDRVASGSPGGSAATSRSHGSSAR